MERIGFYMKKIIKWLLPDSILKRVHFARNRIKIINTKYDDTVRFAYEAQVRESTILGYSSIGRYTKITHTNIGKYCSISWDVTINAVSHNMHHLTTHSFPRRPDLGFGAETDMREYQTVIIKNDVWIGANCVIMPGVVVGNGAIIGAGAVVTKDVPDYAVIVGIPGKIIRYRFPEKVIEELLNLKWWDFKPDFIRENISYWQGDVNLQSIQKIKEICKY